MNPPGMFDDGVRVRQWTPKNLLAMSGKLIQEFDRRRNIRDMFSRKPAIPTGQSSNSTFPNGEVDESPQPMPNPSQFTVEKLKQDQPTGVALSVPPAHPVPEDSASTKRSRKEPPMPAAKRVKPVVQRSVTSENSKGQKSLRGFFQPKVTLKSASQSDGMDGAGEEKVRLTATGKYQIPDTIISVNGTATDAPTPSPAKSQQSTDDSFVDPIVSKESWGKLFVKPAAPKCEHEEPCKTMLTKKTGVNCGRSFWMCARPLGPSGSKERGSQWRCCTFIWASDWNGGGG